MDQTWAGDLLNVRRGAYIRPLTSSFSGAGDQIRTGDPHLGKVILETRRSNDPKLDDAFSQA